jgi:phospholipid transport system substrate-binding protein
MVSHMNAPAGQPACSVPRRGLRLPALLLLLLALIAPAALAETPVAAVAADSTADAASVGTPEEAARRAVEGFHDAVIEVMKSSGTSSFMERETRMGAALDDAFDMTLMAKTSIGKVWKGLDDESKRDWVALSRRYSAGNYAKNFKDWSGQTFATHGVEPAARGTLVVKTELVQPTDDNVTFDYRLRKVGDRWLVIDVQIDGKVSEITMRRADYRSAIERKGYEQLVADVTRKIEGFERE